MEAREVEPSEEGAGRAKAIARRRVIFGLVGRVLPWLRIAMFIAGVVWMVNTYWHWREVHAADRYLEDLEKLRDTNATSQERANYFRSEFEKLGLPSAIQPYTIHAPTGDISGVNAYAIYASPRTSGSEAIVLSASWKSLKWDEDGSLNLRGVATILALAGYLKRYTLWAKDIVLVISDGYLDGMHAWLSAYHGFEHSSVITDRLELLSGVIWTALCIDYPGHSFSHLGVYFEGLNGRLPNQDLINSALKIARDSNGISVLAYDTLDYLRTDYPWDRAPWVRTIWPYVPKPVQKLINHPETKLFENRAGIVARGMAWQASGRPSGVHGLFHQYRIDAITLYARPSHGPHGFYALGKVIESTTRTMNNLLERLHASFFFYVLTSAQSFVKIGGYLPAAVIMSVAMTLGGLALWVQAGWSQTHIKDTQVNLSSVEKLAAAPEGQTRRSRPVVDTIVLMGCTHGLGAIFLFALGTRITVKLFTGYPLCFLFALSIATALTPLYLVRLPRMNPPASQSVAPLHLVLKASNLCLAGTITALISLLNFSLAAVTVVLLGVPLSYLPPVKPSELRARVGFCLLQLLTPPTLGLIVGLFVDKPDLIRVGQVVIWDWKVLGVWTFPFAMIVYLPLIWQAQIACVLSVP
ncbi:GPI transamidase component GAA1 [Ceratobasidium sp. AG-Ba]|nr:GPI transamidase component GAA1 [Ceratobasidium sp. AG-Ba]